MSPPGAPNFPMARPVVPKAAAVAHPAQRLATSPPTPSAAPFPHRPQPTAPLPYRPQAAPAVQRLRTQQQRPASAIQRHTAPHSVATRGSVIQCWRCNECGHEIAYCTIIPNGVAFTIIGVQNGLRPGFNRYDRRPGRKPDPEWILRTPGTARGGTSAGTITRIDIRDRVTSNPNEATGTRGAFIIGH